MVDNEATNRLWQRWRSIRDLSIEGDDDRTVMIIVSSEAQDFAIFDIKDRLRQAITQSSVLGVDSWVTAFAEFNKHLAVVGPPYIYGFIVAACGTKLFTESLPVPFDKMLSSKPECMEWVDVNTEKAAIWKCDRKVTFDTSSYYVEAWETSICDMIRRLKNQDIIVASGAQAVCEAMVDGRGKGCTLFICPLEEDKYMAVTTTSGGVTYVGDMREWAIELGYMYDVTVRLARTMSWSHQEDFFKKYKCCVLLKPSEKSS